MVNDNTASVKNTESAPAGAGRMADRKPELASQAVLGFETRYAEARRKAAEAKAKRKTTSGHRNRTESGCAAELRHAVHERLEKGYVLPFDQQIAGRWRRAFREEGLRSEENPVLQLFVTLVPKGGHARASNDKATLDVQSRSKLLTLDYPYIELNKEFLGAIRIDCDGVFASPQHLLQTLEDLVKDGAIPCLPHIIVGDKMDDGTYRRPHLIFLLPPGCAVWKSEDRRCRAGIVRLFCGVYNGLARAMLPLGADPAAPATTMRMKNPLSPIWHTLTPNGSHMPTLSDYAGWVDTRTSRGALVRQAASIQSAMAITPSNILFNTLREGAVALLTEWHFAADSRMEGSRTALADHLHAALEDHARTMALDDAGLSYVVAKVAEYLALNFDPAKLQGGKNRHRILHLVDDMTSVRDRQKAGAEYSHGARRERSFDRLLTAYRAMQEAGENLSPEHLASKAGVSRSTAYRHLAACQRICAVGCIDKKQDGNTPVREEKNPGPGTAARGEPPVRETVGFDDSRDCGDGWTLVSDTGDEADDDDLRLIEEHDVWIAIQEGRIRGCQMQVNAPDIPDIVPGDERYLTATETANSDMPENDRSSALA